MTENPQQSARPGQQQQSQGQDPPEEQQQSQGQDPPEEQQQSQGQDPPGQQQQLQGQDPPGQQQQYLPAQQQQYQEYQGQYPQGAEPGWSPPPKQPTSNQSVVALVLVGAVVIGGVLQETARERQRASAQPPTSASSTPVEAPGAYDYTVGQQFSLGSFSYLFAKVEMRNALGSRFVREDAAEGAVFVLVYFAELNQGNETATVLTGVNTSVTDAQGRTFRACTRCMTALAMSGERSVELFASELQPGLQRRSVVAFEVPDDAVQARLVLNLEERGLFGAGRKRVLLNF